MQLPDGAAAMIVLGRKFKQPMQSDAEWVSQVNRLAEQMAALARVTLNSTLLSGNADVHRQVEAAVYCWHRWIPIAIET